jgi:hypothetical protein
MKRCEDSQKHDLAKLRLNAPLPDQLEHAWNAYQPDLRTLALDHLRDPWIVSSFMSLAGRPDNRALQAQRVVQQAFASVCRRRPELFERGAWDLLKEDLELRTLFFVNETMKREDDDWLSRHLARICSRVARVTARMISRFLP